MDNANDGQKSSVSYYGKTPSGVEMALVIVIDDVPVLMGDGDQPAERLDALVAYVTELDAKMATLGYQRSERLDKPARGGGGGRAPQPPPTIVNPETGEVEEVKCPKCAGPVWDNVKENDARATRGEKLRPDYACKNKEVCGGVIWRPK